MSHDSLPASVPPASAPPADEALMRAVREAVAGRCVLLGAAGRLDGGVGLFLARDLVTRSLVALRATPSAAVPGTIDVDVVRAATADSPDAPWSAGATPEVVEMIARALAGRHETLGRLDADGEAVLVLRERATGTLSTLHLAQRAVTEHLAPGRVSVVRRLGSAPLRQASAPATPAIVAAPVPPAPATTTVRGRAEPAPTTAASAAAATRLDASEVSDLDLPPPDARGTAPRAPTAAPPGHRAAAPEARRRRTRRASAAVAGAVLVAFGVWRGMAGRSAADQDTAVAPPVVAVAAPAVEPEPLPDPAASLAARVDSGFGGLGTIRLADLPPGAQVWVDGRRARGSELAVPAGTHRVRVRAPGYTERLLMVVVAARETLEVDASLAAEPAPVAEGVSSAPPAPDPAPSAAPAAATCADLAAAGGPAALAACTAEAGAGDADAAHRLGALLREGRGVARDDAAATGWFRRAAETGHAGAGFEWGRALLDGRGVRRDRAAGLEWVRRAAEAGHADARALLATRREATDDCRFTLTRTC